MTGSGGSALGGAAAAGRAMLLSATGGLTLGSPLVPVDLLCHPATAGGQGIGGGAGTRRSASVIGGGGSSLGGKGFVPQTISIVASGGLSLGGQSISGAVAYHIYMNRGTGDLINYEVPIATLAGDRWTSAPMTVPGEYRLAVRAFDSSTGLEEQNIDVVIELRLEAGGNDVTAVPDAPVGLRAFPLAGGKVRVEWTSPYTDPRRKPLGFHIYMELATSSGSSTLVSTIPWSRGRLGWFSTDLAGLAEGLSYSIGVRAFNAVGEESNARVVTVEVDSTPPGLVDGLAAVATNRQP